MNLQDNRVVYYLDLFDRKILKCRNKTFCNFVHDLEDSIEYGGIDSVHEFLIESSLWKLGIKRMCDECARTEEHHFEFIGEDQDFHFIPCWKCKSRGWLWFWE